MDLSLAFILYAAVFRLAVILTGLVCIVLGFRLLVRDIWGTPSEASIETTGTKLTIKTATPGALFALFGAALIVAMLATGSPEMTLKSAERASAQDGNLQEIVSTTRLKGGDEVAANSSSAFEALVRFGRQREAAGDSAGAIAAYAEALKIGEVPLAGATVPMHRIAHLYHAEDRSQEALPLARLALSLAPDDAGLYHLLAQILADLDKPEEAMLAAEEAVRLAPGKSQFQATFEALKRKES